MQPMTSWESAQRILCIRLDSMGDVLMTTPALRALKGEKQGRSLALLTSSSGAAVAPFIPEVDEVIVYDAPWMKATPLRSDSCGERRMARRLRGAGFDAAVIFTVFSQNPLPAALLAFLADIPLRLAYCRENPYQLLTDWVLETDLDPQRGIRHEVQRHLDLVAAAGFAAMDARLSFRVPGDAHRRVEHLLAAAGVDVAAPWVAIHPGSTAASRRYPPEGFSHAADLLASHAGLQVVFTGSRSEQPLVETIRRGMAAPSVSLAGCLDLAELGALLSQAPLLISNNTGPVHIAAALGTPVVDLYALTNPQHTPWSVPSRVLNHDVPCKWCFKSTCPQGHHQCLRGVPPETVAAAAVELLGETQRLGAGARRAA